MILKSERRFRKNKKDSHVRMEEQNGQRLYSFIQNILKLTSDFIDVNLLLDDNILSTFSSQMISFYLQSRILIHQNNSFIDFHHFRIKNFRDSDVEIKDVGSLLISNKEKVLENNDNFSRKYLLCNPWSLEKQFSLLFAPTRHWWPQWYPFESIQYFLKNNFFENKK